MRESLSESVVALIDQLPPPPNHTVEKSLEDLRRALDGPLRIAIVGRVKVGKSTIVNAMLGQRVAATDAGECTRIPAVFTFGFPEKAELLYSDGTTSELPIGLGPLGGDFPEASSSRPSLLSVALSNELLRDFTIIDTPGFGSANVEVSSRTWNYLLPTDGKDALIADAILFVLSGQLVQEERAALAAINMQYSSDLGMAVSTFGVLTRIDQYAEGSDLRLEADERTLSYRSELSEFVADVFPVLGLLAETATGGLLTEADSSAIARLAEVNDAELASITLSVDRFRLQADWLDQSVRDRLLGLLGLYGVQLAVRLHRSGHRGAAALTKALLDASRIEPLRHRLVAQLNDNADALRASRALRVLRDLSFSTHPDDASKTFDRELRNRVEVLRSSAQMHALDEHETHHALTRDLIVLPDPWHDNALRITSSASSAELFADADAEPNEIMARIAQAIDAWRSFSYSCGDPEHAKAADVVIRSLELAQHRVRSREVGWPV
jgi:hypothetical protein